MCTVIITDELSASGHPDCAQHKTWNISRPVWWDINGFLWRTSNRTAMEIWEQQKAFFCPNTKEENTLNYANWLKDDQPTQDLWLSFISCARDFSAGFSKLHIFICEAEKPI